MITTPKIAKQKIKKMQKDRHDRVDSLIKQMSAEFIQAEANPNPLITVTGIKTAPDYHNSTIYITTIPEEREEDALVFLKRHAGEMRHFIMKKSNLKVVPHLNFEIDRGERHRQHIDDVARDI